jgi:GDPmannose 4,6-dehydratase
MWLMLQQSYPEDYVIVTGKCHSVRDVLEIAFSHLDLDYRNYLVQDNDLYRPSEVYLLQGDASKTPKKLSWYPTVCFEDLIREMVDSDLELFKNT